ncbi:MAG: 30S ribosomal protein S21 [Candidatus Eisenbacteria bacterium]
MRKHQHFEKPSERRKRKENNARRKMQAAMRSRLASRAMEMIAIPRPRTVEVRGVQTIEACSPAQRIDAAGSRTGARPRSSFPHSLAARTAHSVRVVDRTV